MAESIKNIIYTPRAPRPIGPYSQAVRIGNTLFLSGQIPIDPNTGRIVEGGIEEQTERVLENIKSIIEDSGFTLRDVAWVLVFLRSLDLYKKFNEVYARYFGETPPARTTVEVSGLPGEALLEVTLIAVKEG